MATTITTSNLFSLDWKDALKGFLVAVITSLLATLGQAVNAGALPTLAQLKIAGLAGITAGISYLLKNFFTGSSTVTTTPSASTPPTN